MVLKNLQINGTEEELIGVLRLESEQRLSRAQDTLERRYMRTTQALHGRKWHDQECARYNLDVRTHFPIRGPEVSMENIGWAIKRVIWYARIHHQGFQRVANIATQRGPIGGANVVSVQS